MIYVIMAVVGMVAGLFAGVLRAFLFWLIFRDEYSKKEMSPKNFGSHLLLDLLSLVPPFCLIFFFETFDNTCLLFVFTFFVFEGLIGYFLHKHRVAKGPA